MLNGAVKAAEDVVELAKTAKEKASSTLVTLHEGVFPEKEVPKDLKELAGSFDAEGGFVADFARDNTVRGLESTLVVLLGHDASCDFNRMVSSVPVVTAANLNGPATWRTGCRRPWRSVIRAWAMPLLSTVGLVECSVL